MSALQHSSYDVVIIGGAIMGSSSAFFLSQNPDFNGRILVVEMDPSYAKCSTAHTNSCIRQQFSNALNVQISQFGAEFIKGLRGYMGDDPRVPEFGIQNYGYLYLAQTEAFAETLRTNQKLQRDLGTETELLSAEEIKTRYPFYSVDDIILGSINRKDEGYWDGGTVFDWMRRKAREGGAEYVQSRVAGMDVQGGKVRSVTLESGDIIQCGQVINCSGPRAAVTARMAGIDLPVEPRKRFTWIFSAQTPLAQELPLTIDPSGVHMRQDGPKTYMAGCAPEVDPAVDPDDFRMDPNRWEEHVWPIIAARVPQFESIRVVTEWAGHYAYNTLDQNAIVGPHPEIGNFIFLNGFSGHGLQQSPAMGRAASEWATYGEYRTLDMTPLGFERVLAGRGFEEKAII